MFRTVEGYYQDGQIKLIDLPQCVNEYTQVIVTFLEPSVDTTKLNQLIEQIETVGGIQQGFDELNAGKTRSIEAFFNEMQEKYDISS